MLTTTTPAAISHNTHIPLNKQVRKQNQRELANNPHNVFNDVKWLFSRIPFQPIIGEQ